MRPGHWRYAQWKASRQSRLPGPPPGQPGGAQPRVDELVDPEVEQGQRGAEQGYREAWWHPPPPVPVLGGRLALRPEQDRAPAPVRSVDQAEKRQCRVGADAVDDGEKEGRGDDGYQNGHDLEADDPPAALADDARRVDEVPVPERQRLDPEHPGAPRPAGDADDQPDQQVARVGVLRQEP